ncbi:THUMP domain-containing class I SAM-dependent RNA methyltransferase [Chitinilyticum litopenaei]|uniref:THUMP domain-containing class I SAM-dependent RNA methyltransferase n=1 Tax=Chitinilyticum litopenaei TaxID=1121276 RepID=UPI0004289341|nr:THUMP domain-containing protein [Chitinilyticum litopenaei]
MLQTFQFFAPCPRGLETLLASEITRLGARDVKVADGGVGFAGAPLMMYRVNLHSRLASRVLWKLAERPYRSEEDIYQLARGVEWPALFALENTIKVGVTAIKSPLKSPDFAALKVKDAVCDAFRAKTGARPSVETHAPDMRIQLFLTDRMATLYLDTSGEPLFKRGYRKETGTAPLRENLAAGIVQLSGWRPDEPLLDPMCGSGTILIEAAMLARNVAPGLKRAFAFQKFRDFAPAIWQKLLDEAQAAQTAQPLEIYGRDIDSRALYHAESNLQAAGLADAVRLQLGDYLDAAAPAEHGVLLTNPPYGVRLEEQQHLMSLYPQWGDVLKQEFAGWRAYFFTGDMQLAKTIRLKASKRTPLYNGALDCRLFEFVMVHGGNRD